MYNCEMVAIHSTASPMVVLLRILLVNLSGPGQSSCKGGDRDGMSGVETDAQMITYIV